MLDIDRDRQRISLGLKQTQEDPWQRVVDTYNIGDELEGTVTKVVTLGGVEILDGVEGLVHISELAQHHVENPREIIQPGDPVEVKILEIDSERRRLSLSIKRVEGQVLPVQADRAAIRSRRGRPGRRAQSSGSPRMCSPRPTSPPGSISPPTSRQRPAPEAEAAPEAQAEAAPAVEAGSLPRLRPRSLPGLSEAEAAPAVEAEVESAPAGGGG